MSDQDQELRALSLWQLSASAIAHGAKRVETRTWPAPEWIIGKRIAIHASKTLGPGGLFELRRWMEEEVNIGWLCEAGYMELDDDAKWRGRAADLPRGYILATAVIAACVPTADLASEISDLEWSHGDFTPGRCGWVFTDVKRLVEPVQVPGSLGLWKVWPGTAKVVLESESIDVEPIREEEFSADRPAPRRFSR